MWGGGGEGSDDEEMMNRGTQKEIDGFFGTDCGDAKWGFGLVLPVREPHRLSTDSRASISASCVTSISMRIAMSIFSVCFVEKWKKSWSNLLISFSVPVRGGRPM